jgi:hypothetical protein
MVRFKVGIARKRTDKSPKRIDIGVLLILSLSLSLCLGNLYVCAGLDSISRQFWYVSYSILAKPQEGRICLPQQGMMRI